jgi:excisionase family DNA binding protein
MSSEKLNGDKEGLSTKRPLTIREAAEALGLSEHCLRSWVATRKLGYVRLGRAIRIPATEIQRILERGWVPARERQ